ncbi:MAG: hypothetical protein HW400_374 [Candidatus Levybacteria bacterium]|nr:hypothetical protein [Candidatus Levybacteria bacterium]
MVERGYRKFIAKAGKIGCATVILATVAFGIGESNHLQDLRQEKVTKEVTDFLRKQELLRIQSLVPLNVADNKTFSKIQGYFNYPPNEKIGGKSVAMVQFAWEGISGVVISKIPLENAKVLMIDRNPTVAFDIRPEDFKDKQGSVNDYILNSKLAFFSVPRGDFEGLEKHKASGIFGRK